MTWKEPGDWLREADDGSHAAAFQRIAQDTANYPTFLQSICMPELDGTVEAARKLQALQANMYMKAKLAPDQLWDGWAHSRADANNFRDALHIMEAIDFLAPDTVPTGPATGFFAPVEGGEETFNLLQSDGSHPGDHAAATGHGVHHPRRHGPAAHERQRKLAAPSHPAPRTRRVRQVRRGAPGRAHAATERQGSCDCGALDDRKAQKKMASLENGRGPALQRRVSCLVDLLMVQAACGEGRQLFDDGLHAPGGGAVFLRLEGVAQDVTTGASHLADDLQVHAGPPLPQHFDVVLPHHRVVFVPPRGQAALPAASVRRVRGSAVCGKPKRQDPSVTVFQHPCQLRVHLALVWVDLLGLQPPASGLGADELAAGLFVGPVHVLGFLLA